MDGGEHDHAHTHEEDEEGAHGPVPPALQGVLLAVYLAYTLFAVVVWVQFVRKLKSFYLKRRFPYFALLQISACFVAWTSFMVVIFTAHSTAHCFCEFAFAFVATNTLLLAMFIRVWGLFWRIFLGQYLSESRKKIRTRLHSSASSHDLAHGPLSKLHGILSKQARLNLLQFGLPSLFAALVIIHAIATIVSFALNHAVLCQTHSGSYTTMQILSMPQFALCFGLSAVIAWNIRKFRDNVGINREIQRLFVVMLCGFPLIATAMALHSVIGDLYDLSFYLGTFLLQALFFVSGYLPLRAQRRLERKVASCDFGELESFDVMLNEDAAALVAFEQFMKSEFCEEMLEFSQAVSRYRRMHDLSTPSEQLSMARVVFAQFISAEAPAQINISNDFLEEISMRLFDSTSVTKLAPGVAIQHAPIDVFDAAQGEMHKLMREGPFMRFQLSDKRTQRVNDKTMQRISVGGSGSVKTQSKMWTTR